MADNPLQGSQNQADGKPAVITGALARSALLFEVDLTPKPGLVDTENNGSHPDLTGELFYRSAKALEPYFSQYWQIGADKPLPAIFPALRSLGLEAEAEMFAATGGRNTHKGAHFCLGLVLATAGYLYHQADWPSKRANEEERSEDDKARTENKEPLSDNEQTDDKGCLTDTTAQEADPQHLTTVAKAQLPGNAAVRAELQRIELVAELLSFVPRICGDLIATDLNDPAGEYQTTAGAESFRRYGIGGIRAEVSSGFPSITKYGLLMLKSHALGQSVIDAGGKVLMSDRKLTLDYLMTLIARVEDTTLIKRGGLAGLRYAQSAAANYLNCHAQDDCWEEALRLLDVDFQARNLSPGGAADLLAVTYLAFSLITEIF
ncbi:MAG: triphosphoribosyl-dephospho-CoA synthase [Saccharofermentanales bacterium]|jgi:triphosphoribosyl-dephospho-CoA synthetase|nr:triphosphoribosyl-dephospho-CoA synthase [Bacillota bacterium]